MPLDLDAIRARLQTVVPGALHRQAAADIAALLSELDRLQSGGCARDQRTTQFCAEVVAKDAEIRRLTAELAAAQAEIAQLRPVVEWTAVGRCFVAVVGRFEWLVVGDNQLSVFTFGWQLSIVGDRDGDPCTVAIAGGPETGEAGKAAAKAAYLRACSLPAR